MIEIIGVAAVMVLIFCGNGSGQVWNPIDTSDFPKPCRAVSGTPDGTAFGRIEVVPGVAWTAEFGQVRVVIAGLANSTMADENGTFRLEHVPNGIRTLVFLPTDARFAASPQRVRTTIVTSDVGEVNATDIGTFVMARPGSVTGRIIMEGTPWINMASLVISIPRFGLVTKPNPDGGYLLTGVPPGTWNVRLMGPGVNESRETTRLTYVASLDTTVGVDFVIRGNSPAATQIEPGKVPMANAPAINPAGGDEKQNSNRPEKPGETKKPSAAEKSKSAVKDILNNLSKTPKKP
jgi:hypothetical protein